MTKDMNLKQLPCLYCDQPDIKHTARATWVCQNCKEDNSLYYVLVAEAVNGEETE